LNYNALKTPHRLSPFKVLRYVPVSGAVSLALVALAACSAPTSSNASFRALPGIADTVSRKGVIDYSFLTIDNPNSPNTHITGMNSLGKVVGYYGTGTASDPAIGFVSVPPYTKFTRIIYPGGTKVLDTYPTTVTNGYSIGGYFTNEFFNGDQTWMFYRHGDNYVDFRDHKDTQRPGMFDALLGLNDSNTAVGYYVDTNGNDQPIHADFPYKDWNQFNPPDYQSAEATGISGRGYVSGWEVTKGGTTQGWMFNGLTYEVIQYPYATSTEALSLSWAPAVAGQYVDTSGNTHGFVLLHAGQAKAKQVWETIDEPNAAGGTVVTAINQHNDIAGWYVDSKGNYEGFVATITK
jgi:hypothetical protein